MLKAVVPDPPTHDSHTSGAKHIRNKFISLTHQQPWAGQGRTFRSTQKGIGPESGRNTQMSYLEDSKKLYLYPGD